jgi:glycoprotein-N-acetylgalactosamine 3-beta-galactosyltransferase
MVYTMEDAHATTIRAIRETWAGGCDGFLAFSTVSDPRIPAISLEHLGPESYDNMWQKVRSIWKFVATHYLDEFDWFFQGGDDLFVIPQNLRSYLDTLGSPEQDYFVGRRFKAAGHNNYFNSGGAGYGLSRGTLRKYRDIGWNHTLCSPKQTTSMEDVMIAQCLRRVFQIDLTDTRDSEGRERFHPFAPGSHYHWKPPVPPHTDWYDAYNQEWGLLLGKECCAPDSVSFHYIKKPAMVRHIHSLLNHCKN